MTRSLSFRLLMAAFLWVAATLTAGGFVLSIAFRDYVVTDFDVRLAQLVDHLIGASEIDEDGLIRLTRPIADQRFMEPYSGWYWQVTGEDGEAFRSRSLWDEVLDIGTVEPAFTARVLEITGPEDQRLRVMMRDAVPAYTDQVFRFAVAGDTEQIRRDIEAFDRLIIWSLGFLGAGLLIAVGLQVWIGLLPLKTLRRGLARIRSGRVRRLEGRFPTEIEPLVGEMNALIEHNERVVERARTHVGNLAHALKTPLTVLQGEARKGDGKLAGIVGNQTAIMAQQIDHHLKRARAAGSGMVGTASAVGPPLAELLRALAKIYAGQAISVETDVDDAPLFRGERQDLMEMLGNLLDNAFKWADTRIRVSARRLPDRVRPMLEIVVEDDGPGIDKDKAEALFERGSRLDETKPGSGLGLAIVREIAELCGGGVRLETSVLGGLRAVLVLPAALP